MGYVVVYKHSVFTLSPNPYTFVSTRTSYSNIRTFGRSNDVGTLIMGLIWSFERGGLYCRGVDYWNRASGVYSTIIIARIVLVTF